MADDYVQEDFFAVLDAAESAKRKDKAMAQVDAHTLDPWRQAARQALKHLAETQEYLTPDDLWATGLPKPSEARASGPIFMWAARQKFIEDSGRSVLTAQVSSHRTPIRVWRSLLWAGA